MAVVTVCDKAGNQAQNPQEAIRSVCQIWLLFGGALVGSYPELADSCRDIFRDVIYSVRDADAGQANGGDQSNPKGTEIEVMKLSDLVSKIQEQIRPQTLQEDQVESLRVVFGRPNLGGMVMYEDVQSVFSPLGVRDFKVPKG